MFGRNSIKGFNLQLPEDKIYILKLIAHQKLGEKWIYYRKIKRGDQGLKIFKQKSLMDQMKATQAALRFTTKNARKLYRTAYLNSVKDIKTYTGLKEGFPDPPESEDGESIPSLTSQHDAVIIEWTPLKFLLPVVQLRAKGLATQRHTEGLAAKLFFKVAGFYSDPRNWDRFKLNLYLKRITKTSSYQEIVNQLEPLKSDLDKFVEAFEPFKFGKASLSKDITSDTDTFDDAMGIESFDSQLKTLYWYHFIYHSIELFVFKYYLTLVTSTVSFEAMRYITHIFEPVLQKAIENRVVFLGSFEIDRNKRTFRVPYRKLIQEKAKAPETKNIKTHQGAFETYTYNLPLLDHKTINYELVEVPEADSEWGTFVKHYILNIDRPSLAPEKEESDEDGENKEKTENKELLEIEEEKKKLIKEKEDLITEKKGLLERKKILEKKQSNSDSLDKMEKLELEEEKAKILNEDLELDKKVQKLKEKYSTLELKQKEIQFAEEQKEKKKGLTLVDLESLIQFDKELQELPIRQYALMNMMTTMMNANHFKRLARYKILERFKARAANDQELEEKRISEIQKKAVKKLRELKRKKSKMDRLKQDETVSVMTNDIARYENGIAERIEIIRKDSQQELVKQKERLNSLFKEISKEKSIDLGATSKLILKLIAKIDTNSEFQSEFAKFVSTNMQESYSAEMESFYKNLFSIFDLTIEEKLMMIQSLEKSGGDQAVKLKLDDGEEREIAKRIATRKIEIEQRVPDLFSCKVVFLAKLIVVDDLFRLSIDSKSINTLLLLKIVSPKRPQQFNLNGETVKELIDLNKMINPVPKHRVMQEGSEDDKNLERRINSTMLNHLLEELV